jgi:hypothetical protein
MGPLHSRHVQQWPVNRAARPGEPMIGDRNTSETVMLRQTSSACCACSSGGGCASAAKIVALMARRLCLQT